MCKRVSTQNERAAHKKTEQQRKHARGARGEREKDKRTQTPRKHTRSANEGKKRKIKQQRMQQVCGATRKEEKRTQEQSKRKRQIVDPWKRNTSDPSKRHLSLREQQENVLVLAFCTSRPSCSFHRFCSGRCWQLVSSRWCLRHKVGKEEDMMRAVEKKRTGGPVANARGARERRRRGRKESSSARLLAT